MLYECLVGEPPFTGEAQSVLYRIVHEFPQAPRARGAAIDEALEEIVLRCLARSPASGRSGPARSPRRSGATARGCATAIASRHVAELTRTRARAAAAASLPFIGREKESAELQQRLNAAIAGECQFVLVGGEPGIGKTRLLDELENLAKARQIRVLHGRFVEQDRGLPYQGFLEMIQEYFRVKDTGSAPPPDFSDLAPDLRRVVPHARARSPSSASAAGSGTRSTDAALPRRRAGRRSSSCSRGR